MPSSTRRRATPGATRPTSGWKAGISWSQAGGGEKLADHAGRWRAAGATHISVNTMNAGLGSVDGHLAALTAAAEALGLTA